MDIYNSRIDYIIDKYAPFIMKDPNIVGIGRSKKEIKESKTNTPSVTFFVKEKVSENSLSSNNIIPKFIGGTVTDVVGIGEISHHAGGRIRPARGGLSIGINVNEKFRTGTIGYSVSEKGARKNIYILTACHALTQYGKPFGNPPKVYQPSIELGGNISKDEIGIVDKIIPLRDGIPTDGNKYNEVDAALIKVGPASQDTVNDKLVARLNDNTIITGIIDAVEDSLYDKQICIQAGVSGKVVGTVISERAVFKATTPIASTNFTFMYKNQVLCKINNTYGDSGALGYSAEGNKAFGLLWGGSDNSRYGRLGVFSPIKKVLDLLKVELL